MNARPISPHARFGSAVAAGLVGLLWVAPGGGGAAAEPTREQLDAARAMVAGTGKNKGNDKLVLGFAYPTARGVTKIDYVSKTAADDGSFTLTYRYTYRDRDNDPQDFQMRFEFGATGKLTGARPVADKHSSFWPPMTAAELTLGLLQEAIRNDEKRKNDPVWKPLLAVTSPSEFMVGIMNIKAGK
jgi:hypothetical protein